MDPIEFRIEILLDLYAQSLKRGTLTTRFSNEFIEKYNLREHPDDNSVYDSGNNIDITEWNESINKLLIFNLQYLEEKDYLSVNWGSKYQIFGIAITSYGVDVAEFALYGKTIDDNNPDTRFHKLLSSITKSGISVLEGSAVGLVNIALQNLLK